MCVESSSIAPLEVGASGQGMETQKAVMLPCGLQFYVTETTISEEGPRLQTSVLSAT